MDRPPSPPDEPVTLTAVAPPKKRGRRWRVALVLLVGLAAVVWFAPVIVAHTSLRDSILHAATAKLHGTVTVGGVSLGWLQPVELTDVVVLDADGREVLTAPVVRTSNTLFSLTRNRSDLGTVTVERPTLTVVCADRTNLEDLLAKLIAEEREPGERPAVTVEVTDARVLVAEPGNPPRPVLERASATVIVPREREAAVKFTAKADAAAAPGRVEATADIGPTLAATAKVSQVTLDGFGPLVRRFAPGTRLGGTLTGDVTTQIGATTTFNGRAEVLGFDLASPVIGPDRVRLARATLPCNVTIAGDVVTVGDGTELDCDVGKVSVSGTVSPSDTPDKMLSRHGLKATADVDVAKLAALIPRLLRIREGTALTSGRVHAEVASVAGPRGVGWKGHVETTSLHGTRDGKPIGWEQPFKAVFDAHLRPDGLPEFDDLQCQSDFVGLHARGTVSKFVARANLDLDKLSAHLNEFVDLGGAALSGTGTLDVNLYPSAGGGPSGLTATLTLARFVFRDAAGHGLNEPALTVRLIAAGNFVPTKPVLIDQANLEVIAAQGDRFSVNLTEPVADARTAHNGKMHAKLVGDLGRWRARVGQFVGLPPELALGGTGDADAKFELTPDAVRCPTLTADVKELGFRGFGVFLVEQQPVHLETGLSLDRKTGAVELSDLRLSSETVGASAKAIDLTPLPNDAGWGVKGKLAVTANVGRVQRAIGLAADVAGLANGRVGFDIGAGGTVRYDADLTADNLAFGPPQKPTWIEPRVKLTAAGAWDPANDGVKFDRLHVERDGLTVDASGAATKMSSPAAKLDVSGTLAYDLAKIETQLRSYLGPDARAVGNESRPFQLSGPIGEGGKNLTVTVGTPKPAPPPATKFDQLTGSAAVAWQMLRAYGFEVGPAELKAGLEKGVVHFSPVKAEFGGGTVELKPTLRLDPTYDLTFAPGRVVTNAKLTPQACANAVGFVLPPLANAAEVEGLVSLDLAENTVPLTDPTRAKVRGTVMVHNATVAAGPVISEIMTALGAPQTAFTLTQEQAVPFHVENGRVYHDRFVVMIEKTAITTSGSVGFDGTLGLFVDVQVPPKFAQQLFPNNPLIREAVAKQTLRLAVGGTLQKPKLEPGTFRAAVQKASRDAAKDAAGGFLRRGFEKPEQK